MRLQYTVNVALTPEEIHLIRRALLCYEKECGVDSKGFRRKLFDLEQDVIDTPVKQKKEEDKQDKYQG